MQYTSIRVRRDTLEMLKAYKERIGVDSFDEAILQLLKNHRRFLADKYYGIDKGKISRFTEEDRLESREL